MDTSQPELSFLKRNERRLTLTALLAGFIVDTLTLTRIDLLFDNLILFSYLLIAVIAILLINTLKSGRLRRWLPYLMQYAFGGLFSGYIIFYSKSATLIGNWPFLALLLILFLGNEVFKTRYQRLTFQLSILFIAIFSFTIFFIPVIVGAMGPLIFIISGIVSLGLIRLIIGLLALLRRRQPRLPYRALTASILTIYIFFNALYFTNLIPPIPLALKELDVYYSVDRTTNGDFLVYAEERPWYAFYRPREFQYRSGDALYSYSAVFAPTRITSTISHRWSYFDETSQQWTVRSTIPFSIAGGRDGGYRGYTLTSNMTAGKWRVDVITDRDQLLGRTTFSVKKTTERPELHAEIR